MPRYNDADVINSYLEKCGVKYSQIGFKYLVAVFMILGKNPNGKITLSQVYEKVAEQYDVDPRSVGKAISYSIKHCSITNKEFIYKALNRNFMPSESDRPPVSVKKQVYGQNSEPGTFVVKGVSDEGLAQAERIRKTRAGRTAVWASCRK